MTQYLLGEHILVHADSQTLDTSSLPIADMIWTDPPYGVAYAGDVFGKRIAVGKKDVKQKARKTIEGDSLTGDALESLIVAVVVSAPLRAGGVVYLMAPAGPLLQHFITPLNHAGWLRQVLVWEKQQIAPSRSDYHYKHEPILYGWKPGAAHYWAGDRKQTSLLKFRRPQKSPLHPTQKPLELVQYCILNNTKRGDTVYDPFAGSGTTLMACEATGRRSVSVEIDDEYIQTIITRWEYHTGKKAVQTR